MRFWVVHTPFPLTHTLAEGSEINFVKLQMKTGSSLTGVREGSNPPKKLWRRLAVGEECPRKDGCSGRNFRVSEVELCPGLGAGRHCWTSLSAAQWDGERPEPDRGCEVQSHAGQGECHPQVPGKASEVALCKSYEAQKSPGARCCTRLGAIPSTSRSCGYVSPILGRFIFFRSTYFSCQIIHSNFMSLMG